MSNLTVHNKLPALDANKALAEMCRRSFYRFFQEFWGTIVPETPVYNWHIKYLCDELQYLASFFLENKPKPYDLIINIPPGMTKSTLVTQMYNAWLWAKNPRIRLIASSYSGNLSISHAVKTRDIITSEKYQLLFPDVVLKEDQQGKTDFRTVQGGQRFSTSTGGTVTGVHAHVIVVDDPINPKQALSEIEREEANEFVTSTLSTRKIDKSVTPIILVMQRLHQNDPTGAMLAKKSSGIKHICLPAELKEGTVVLPEEAVRFYQDGLLDPRRLPRPVLAEARTDLGSYGYAGQYDQNPAPSEGGLIKKTWFEIIDWDPRMAKLTWKFVADTAYTSSERNDPSGYWAYAEYGNNFIIRNATEVYLEFPDLCRDIVSFAQLNGYTSKSIMYVEPKASGKSLVQTLKSVTKLNVKEGKPPAKDKTARLKDVSPTVEAGRVKFIRGPWNKAVIDQICTFPNATHDTFVDLLTMTLSGQKVKKGIKRLN